MQRKELEYAAAPLPADYVPYESGVPAIHPPWMEVFGRMTPLNGDAQVTENVRVMHVRGILQGSRV